MVSLFTASGAVIVAFLYFIGGPSLLLCYTASGDRDCDSVILHLRPIIVTLLYCI